MSKQITGRKGSRGPNIAFGDSSEATAERYWRMGDSDECKGLINHH